MSKLSIIIPILNEAETIGGLLQHLSEHASSDNIAEIIIVDGGSKDGSVDIVKNIGQSFQETGRIQPVSIQSRIPGITRPDIQLVLSDRGRARQMNTGARKATGNILYFLHADTLPPDGFDQQVIKQIEQGHTAGCFRMKFDKSYPVLRFSQWFTRFNFRFCRGGDQSLFITKELFDQLEGFNENFGVYEDCEFIGRIYDNHKFSIINDYVITSARKYERNGSWRLQYHFTVIHLKKWLGASPDALQYYYQKYIA